MGIDRALRRAALALLLGSAALAGIAAEDRPGTIDEILLIDKSLSMRGSIEAAKALAEKELVSSILVPGDRLVVEVFYGKIERLFAGTIRSAADKEEAIRRIAGIRADGAYTDIGAVLDRAGEDLVELDAPERPKYVVLLTDERQEAPPGSPYVSPDYRLRHPALTYVRRIDKGGFHEIVVGLDVARRIAEAAPSIMQILSDPPARSDADFPPLPPDTPPGLALGAPEGARGAAAGAQGGAATASPGAGGAAAGPGGPGGATGAAKGPSPALLLGGVLALVALAGAAAGTLLLTRRRKRDRESHDA